MKGQFRKGFKQGNHLVYTMKLGNKKILIKEEFVSAKSSRDKLVKKS